MPKDQKPIDVEVAYCQAWGGYGEAVYTTKLIKTAFPQAKVNMFSPGKTGNLVVKYNGQTIFDKKGGDGSLNEEKSIKLVQKLQVLSKWVWDWMKLNT